MAKKPSSSLYTSTSSLSDAVSSYFNGVNKTISFTPPNEDYTPEVRDYLFYVIHIGPPSASRIPTIGLEFVDVRMDTTGDVFRIQYLAHSTSRIPTPRAHWHSVDRNLYSRIELLVRDDNHRDSYLVLTHPDALPLLADIVATGRARLRDVNGPTISFGSTRTGHVEWTPVDSEYWQAQLKLDDGAGAEHLEVLCAATAVWIDPRTGEIGLVDVGKTTDVVHDLLWFPRVRASGAVLAEADLGAREGALAPRPIPDFGQSQVIHASPTPIITLFSTDRRDSKSRKQRGRKNGNVERIPLARLSFQYETFKLHADPRSDVAALLDGNAPVWIHRDPIAEDRARRMLAESGMKTIWNMMWWARVSERNYQDFTLPNGKSWPAWLQHTLPELRNDRWNIVEHAYFPWRVLHEESEFIADEYDDGAPIDWLNLKLGVMIEGEYVDIIGPLIRMIRKGELDRNNVDGQERIAVTVTERRILLIPKARLVPYLEGLEALCTVRWNGGTPALRSPYLLAVLARLLRTETPDELAWQRSDALRDLVERLRNTETIPRIVIPGGFKATLREFQVKGASWLKFLSDNGLGGILADEMGLGKTLQALAYIAAEKASGRLDRPVLVVVPRSLLGHWERQTKTWAPDLRMCVFHGSDRELGSTTLGACDVVLTTYGTAAQDEGLSDVEWSCVLCDEAQLAKNRDTATAAELRTLKARVRFCLTGTPLENNLDELWAQYDFVVPGYLGDRESFHLEWATPIEKDRDERRLADLAVRIRPFLLRRTKAEVAPDLPKKVEKVIEVKMREAQRVLYDTVRIAMVGQVQKALEEHGLDRTYRPLLAALTKMRQICCDPRLTPDLPNSATAGSAKLERLVALVEQRVAGGHKVLVFSAFAKMLDLIGTALDDVGIAHVTLTGQTQDRDKVIARFQDEDIPVFLISLKAGGAGLDLSVADTVVLYDGWWNPASEAQAIDRAHRIGQVRPVIVYRLKASDTIEDEMAKLKRRKSALVNALMEATDENADKEMEADLAGLNEEKIKGAIEEIVAAFGTAKDG